MEPTLSNIIDFIIDFTGVESVNEHTGIFDDTGCYGDDWHQMIDQYSEQFSVDLSNYLWYFHSPEEGGGFLGGIFFKSPDQRVERIKITPNDIFKMAQEGIWNINYPDHSLPEKRHDIRINAIVFFTLIIGLMLYLLL